MTTDNEAAIITYTSTYKSVYFTNEIEEYNGPYINQSIIFYNAIVWTATTPLTLSISFTSASILVGNSVTFTSKVSGGYAPYSYQWYLNGDPVSGATTENWVFTPTTSGKFYVCLRVKDSQGSTVKSRTVRIKAYTVSTPRGLYKIFPI